MQGIPLYQLLTRVTGCSDFPRFAFALSLNQHSVEWKPRQASFIYSVLAISHVPTTVHYLLLDSDNERTLLIIKQNNYPLLKQTNTNNLIKHPLISGSSKELIYKSNLDPRYDLVIR